MQLMGGPGVPVVRARGVMVSVGHRCVPYNYHYGRRLNAYSHSPNIVLDGLGSARPHCLGSSSWWWRQLAELEWYRARAALQLWGRRRC